MAMLEARRKALAAEGLFAAARKRPLPYLPEVIGVVTSPSGAVIRDILHRLRERFPRPVLLWPVTVQGELRRRGRGGDPRLQRHRARRAGAAARRAHRRARRRQSIEDLWGFNEEIVVRAAAESRIPLISAVGHETDTTLIDLAADRRAPTPTAAAEMAVPVRLELIAARRAASSSGGARRWPAALAQRAPAPARPRAAACRGPRRWSPSGRSGSTAWRCACRWRSSPSPASCGSRSGAARRGASAPGLLALGVARRRQRLVRAEAGVRPEALAARLDRLARAAGGARRRARPGRAAG